ncbi:MAG: DUF72 domain-containing protein [Gemmatimonadota bacterium]|nr:DUF72 domain-containing protein [Gemmatimonadota bacterium]
MFETPGTVLVGTQGWDYPAWVGPFYPPATRPADMLGVFARAFSTVEVDTTFYGTPAEYIVRGWRERVPPGFRFSLKVPQAITHERRLVDAAELLAQFLGRVRLLGDRLGPLLLQMPPDWAPTPVARAALDGFVPGLPTDVRWAMEFRDPRWLRSEVIQLLRAHGVALAFAEGRWVRRDRVLALTEEPTADFSYVRWMGPDRALTDFSRVQVSRDDVFAPWVEAVRALQRRGRTVYGYFNNHFQGHAPASARRLQEALGEEPVAPAALRVQGDLFN